MLYLLVAVILFHFTIILKIVPYQFAWGGRLENDMQMYVFETISVLINVLLILSLLIKGNYIKAFVSMKIVHIFLWVFIVLFGLNTIGNILAKTNFEKFFSILTLAFTLLLWIILRKDKKQTNTIKTDES